MSKQCYGERHDVSTEDKKLLGIISNSFNSHPLYEARRSHESSDLLDTKKKEVDNPCHKQLRKCH